jgi:Flp pilus assembly protein TadG
MTANSVRSRFHADKVSCPRRAAAAVEMAVVLPVFITVVLGMMETGRGIMVAQCVTNAAREAVRFAIIDGSTNASSSAAAKSLLQNTLGVDAQAVTVTVTTPAGDVSAARPRDMITIDVSIPYSSVSWLPPRYLAGLTISGRSAMRHE